MSIFREAGDSLARISGIVIAKTEEFTRIAQLTIEQKRLESALASLERATGRFILAAIENDGGMPDSSDPSMTRFMEQYREIKTALDAKKEEITAVRTDYIRPDRGQTAR